MTLFYSVLPLSPTPEQLDGSFVVLRDIPEKFSNFYEKKMKGKNNLRRIWIQLPVGFCCLPK